MRKSFSAFAGALVAGAGLVNPLLAAAADFTAKDLAAEEGKFAAYSVAHDMKAAFLAFFAEDSIILRPNMVDAKPWLVSRPAPAVLLNWKSQITVLSASKDLGLSTGPSTFTSKKDPSQAPGHGQFFSIWKKQANGEWKVLLDHGISYAGPAQPDKPLEAHDLPAGLATTFEPNDPEQRFIARSTAVGASTAYAEAAGPGTRLLRDERLPIDGEGAVREYAKSLKGNWSWNTLMQGTSTAGDFCYVLGRYTQSAPGEAPNGYYIRAWIKEGGRWTLAGEVLTPLALPASTPAAAPPPPVVKN